LYLRGSFENSLTLPEAEDTLWRALRLSVEVENHILQAGCWVALVIAAGEGDGGVVRARTLVRIAETLARPAAGPIRVRLLNNLAAAEAYGNEDLIAREHFEQAFELARDSLGEDHFQTLTTLVNLGEILENLGDYRESRRLMEKAIPRLEKVLGSEHPTTALALTIQAKALYETGSEPEAIQKFYRALEIFEKVYGELHPQTVSQLNNLGQVLVDEGALEEAQRILERGYRLAPKLQVPRPGTVVDNLMGLGSLWLAKGDLSRASSLLESALDTFLSLPKVQQEEKVLFKCDLGNALTQMGRAKDAGRILDEALAVLDQTHRRVIRRLSPASPSRPRRA